MVPDELPELRDSKQGAEIDRAGHTVHPRHAFPPPIPPPTPNPDPEPEPEPTPEPEPGGSWQHTAWDVSIEHQSISLNPNAALQQAIFGDGYVPVMSEFWLDHENDDKVERAYMAAEHLQSGDRRLYYAVVPQWNNVQWFGEPGTEPPPTPPPQGVEIDVIVDDLPQHPTKNYSYRDLSDITHLTIHHTVSPPDRPIWGIAQYHVDHHDWPGIGYHYVIGDDGKISQTNYLTTKSYHAGSYAAPGDENLFSVGIALQGDFTNAPPPQAQLDAARALVAHLRGLLPNPLAVVGHRQMPGAATACPGATYQDWLPYIVGDEDGPLPSPAPPPPPPPAGPTYDLVGYMFPPNGRIYEVRHPDGSQERIQTQLAETPGVAYIVKGENQGFWELWSWDSTYIYLVRDTSPGPDGVFYDVRTADGRVTPWCKRHMTPGESFADSGHVVTFKSKSDCQQIADTRSGNAQNHTTFVDHFDRYVFDTGIQLDDCVMIKGNTEEHVFAKGYGRVAWYAPWGDSEVSEIHQPGARPDIRRETGCFGG
jgi:hypothetical protein